MKRRSLILFLLALAACNPEALSPDGPSSSAGSSCHSERSEESLVPVSLQLGVAPLENGTPGTKTDYEPDLDGGADWREIRNVALMQFEWVDDDPANVLQAQLVGQKQYFDHWSATGLEVGENFTLVKSTRKNTVLAFANLSKDDISFPVGTTLGSFLKSRNADTIDELADLWYADGDDRYLRMSGSVVLDGVDFGSEVGSSSSPLLLKRNCAKVVVKVRNEAPAAENLVLRNVQLCDVNRKHYFATQLADFADFEAYTPRDPLRLDAPIQELPADGTLTYYIPANLRGRNASGSQYDKNRHAPLGATCLRIYATYGADDTPITYTYYLGADLVNDFNIEPNRKYTYELTLTRKGDPSYDSRIEDLAEKRFLVDANCYLLHPPKLDWQTLTYSFPVRRAAVFWNNAGTNMGVYGAAKSDAAPFVLEETTAWTAGFVWNEIKKDGVVVADADLLLTTSGMGFNPDNADPPAGHQPFIRIRLGEGMEGNALVAVKDASGAILWSWHLWVTEYDPEVEMTPEEHTYIYAVPGGSLHRYNGDLWNTGAYREAFIMDRNLGAMAAVGEYDSHGFYYEPGRKDPFRYGNYSRVNAQKNVIFSVRNPNTFIYNGSTGSGGSDWSPPGPLASQAGKWFDPRFEKHGGDGCEADKSIYDPCPPGWRVPERFTYKDLATGSGDARHREWTLEHPGLNYYPEGYENESATGTIYFPAAGQIWPHSGTDLRHWGYPSRGIQLVQAQNCSYLLVTEDANLTEFNVDSFPRNGNYNNSIAYLGQGRSVRCVRLR